MPRLTKSKTTFSVRPFKLIKKILPKTLLWRTLLILIIPVISIQIVISFVFFDRHLSKQTELLSDNIARNIAFAVDYVTEHVPETPFEKVKDHIERYSIVTIDKMNQTTDKPLASERLDWIDRYLLRSLQEQVTYPFDVLKNENMIYIKVFSNPHVLLFTVEEKNLYTRTTTILIWWAIITPLLFLFIAIVFMKNQIRPLKKLTIVVKDFGKGREKLFKPSGAYEVRKVGQAFNAMKDRIKRQMKERTEMLAGVSHDLKTPLTRMKLELAFMPHSSSLKNIENDIEHMSKMIDEYLAFARGSDGEPFTYINLNHMIKKLAKELQLKDAKFSLQDTTRKIYGRSLQLKRCLTNLFSNAKRYAHHIEITTIVQPKRIKVMIDDDGPGIPDNKRVDVFQAFYRLEDSRNPETGGTGLGLAIAKDIASAHGGRLTLHDSPLGGLRVILSLPL